MSRRELAIVFALCAALYMPLLGSYSLWDPWEGHYAEVARRMLEERDLLFMRWQTETFYSKPPLTFWLMSGGLRLVGVGEDGGFSGEFVASHRGEWGLRFPFALFGIGGVVALWYLLARFVSRRAAWMGAGILATSPFYFFISRQAITDIPTCAMLVVMLALFALAAHGGLDGPLGRWRRVTQGHVFLVVFTAVVLAQLVYFTTNTWNSRWVLGPGRFARGPLMLVPFYVVLAGLLAWMGLTTRTPRQVAMYWFYLLAGLAVLDKGPVAPALAGLAILCYLVLTGDWRLLLRLEIPKGILIALVVCLPWHFAMFLKDGQPWFNEYVGQHLLARATRGVHGDRGTFQYFLGQIGIGMWPWAALIPASLAALAGARKPTDAAGKIRLLLAVWAITGFLFFSIVQTKFHHYILPAVPAFAALVALWLDDLLDGRVRLPAVGVLVSLALFLLLSLDLVPNQSRLVQLFIYRYDRTIPKAAPWNLDFARELALLALAFGLPLAALLVPRLRRWATAGLVVAALAFAVFAMDVLMIRASPHFGQRAQHEIYFKKRRILGVDLVYRGMREVAGDFGTGADLRVPALIPETLRVGDPMTVSWDVGSEKGTLSGQVSRIGRNVFWIAIPPEQRARIAPVVERARATRDPPRRRWLEVNAERLISKLYWRGESYYSGGEVWNPRVPDAQAVFHELNDAENKKFLEYLQPRVGQNRKFWVVTEKGRVSTLRSLLPSDVGKETYRAEDGDTSSFFGLASFTL